MGSKVDDLWTLMALRAAMQLLLHRLINGVDVLCILLRYICVTSDCPYPNSQSVSELVRLFEGAKRRWKWSIYSKQGKDPRYGI